MTPQQRLESVLRVYFHEASVIKCSPNIKPKAIGEAFGITCPIIIARLAARARHYIERCDRAQQKGGSLWCGAKANNQRFVVTLDGKVQIVIK